MKDDRRKEGVTGLPSLLAYVAELELEVDRLRRHHRFVHQEMLQALSHLQLSCTDIESGDAPSAMAGVSQEVRRIQADLQELRDLPGYHPAHDQVSAIAIRPLVERIFHWQQRLERAQDVSLDLELDHEHLEWFPVRLRHVLDNLISNALKYRDPEKADPKISVGLRATSDAYEIRVSDNGIGLDSEERSRLLDLFLRSVPPRQAGLGVGLAVVKMLVEQSNGTLTIESELGLGTTFRAVLPRYDLEDYLL